MSKNNQNQEWIELLNQVDQATGSLETLLKEGMKMISGDNWTRTWRGDVRKGRIPMDMATTAASLATCLHQVELQVRAMNLARDLLGIPRAAIKEEETNGETVSE
jgi:hypothetical protein